MTNKKNFASIADNPYTFGSPQWQAWNQINLGWSGADSSNDAANKNDKPSNNWSNYFSNIMESGPSWIEAFTRKDTPHAIIQQEKDKSFTPLIISLAVIVVAIIVLYFVFRKK